MTSQKMTNTVNIFIHNFISKWLKLKANLLGVTKVNFMLCTYDTTAEVLTHSQGGILYKQR